VKIGGFFKPGRPGLVLKVEYPYFVIDSHTDGLNHEAHEEQEVILC
jgi:hypothetical protein